MDGNLVPQDLSPTVIKSFGEFENTKRNQSVIIDYDLIIIYVTSKLILAIDENDNIVKIKHGGNNKIKFGNKLKSGWTANCKRYRGIVTLYNVRLAHNISDEVYDFTNKIAKIKEFDEVENLNGQLIQIEAEWPIKDSVRIGTPKFDYVRFNNVYELQESGWFDTIAFVEVRKKDIYLTPISLCESSQPPKEIGFSFILLLLCVVLYMVGGALIFEWLEPLMTHEDSSNCPSLVYSLMGGYLWFILSIVWGVILFFLYCFLYTVPDDLKASKSEPRSNITLSEAAGLTLMSREGLLYVLLAIGGCALIVFLAWAFSVSVIPWLIIFGVGLFIRVWKAILDITRPKL